MELRDIAPGLWIWRLEHPDWTPELDWQPMVTSTCVESGGEVALLDPLAPPDDAEEVWARLDAHPPTRGPRPRVSSASGRRPGTRSARFPRCERCSSCRSSA